MATQMTKLEQTSILKLQNLMAQPDTFTERQVLVLLTELMGLTLIRLIAASQIPAQTGEKS